MSVSPVKLLAFGTAAIAGVYGIKYFGAKKLLPTSIAKLPAVVNATTQKPPSPPPVGARPIGVHPTIKQGSNGDDVRLWQAFIGVTADGQFGPQTTAATQKWQGSNGLTADGIVGPMTWAKAGI